MKCSACNHNNQTWAKFCVQCGQQLGKICRHCQKINAVENKFCAECGNYLNTVKDSTKIASPPVSSSNSEKSIGGERKFVTVLFSDLCDYTAISEKIDPEEVKEILNRIFKEIYRIIEKYDGFIEKTMGDGAMILFGCPKAHEDDAIRAIRTAIEIHQKIKSIGGKLKEKLGRRLLMHSGISTGLVVTNPAELMANRQGIAGDTVNLASRLSGMAQPGEILVEENTYRQSQIFFNFVRKPIGPIKGKSERVVVFKVLNPVKAPFRIRSPIGVQANLIGRTAEISQLIEAAGRLQSGRGSIFSISGDAGTGKSRLMLEFRKQLDTDNFLWIEGHAYAYTQKIPYFPLIDMLERIWGINEEEPAEETKIKITEGIENLVGPRRDIEVCIGTLHGFSYPETEEMAPEIWNINLYKAFMEILSALAHRGKTIFCMEDLHWADTSTVHLLRTILPEFYYPAILLYSYRPPFSLFTSHQLKSIGRMHQEIYLKELSLSESHEMMASLLQTRTIPIQLRQFIKDRTEGNPFYLEEMINSLLESNILENSTGMWTLNQAFKESEIPATVQGVIAARLDHLQGQSKRLLQEAAVIGRSFPYEILKHITSTQDAVEHRFNDLERIDLIRTRSLYPDLEFIFKHALTQEVGYNSLLKRERREIHERVASIMEKLFAHRISEFYETLAWHYRRGRSIPKAVSYMIKAGRKSLKCYALTESSQYFSDAYDLLCQSGLQDMAEKKLLIDLLNQWAFVYYYQGKYIELQQLLQQHQELADQCGSGFFYAWLGCALWHRAEFKQGHTLLAKAITLSKKDNDYEALGFAGVWYGYTLTERGRLADALQHAQQTLNLCDSGTVTSHFIYYESLAAMGYTHWHAGNCTQTAKIGDRLMDFGHHHSNTRALCFGHCCHGWSKLIAGDLDAATICFQDAIEISQDPWYETFPKLALSFGQICLGDVDKTTHLVRKLIDFSSSSGVEFVGEPAAFFQGLAMALSGQWQAGVLQMENVLALWLKNEAILRWTLCTYILAQLHLKFALSPMEEKLPTGQENRSQMAHKASLLLEACADKAVSAGMVAIEGQIWLCMGNLNHYFGRPEAARENLQKALLLFERCNADLFSKQAMEALSIYEEV